MKNLEIKITKRTGNILLQEHDIFVEVVDANNSPKIYYGIIHYNTFENTINIEYNQETPNNIQVNVENMFVNIIKPSLNKVNKNQLQLKFK